MAFENAGAAVPAFFMRCIAIIQKMMLFEQIKLTGGVSAYYDGWDQLRVVRPTGQG